MYLQGYNSWISRTGGVKKGDIALLLDTAKRGTTPLVRIRETEMGIHKKGSPHEEETPVLEREHHTV
jgi:hypothetical protein